MEMDRHAENPVRKSRRCPSPFELERLLGDPIRDSQGGTSGFLLKVGAQRWLTVFLERGRLAWRLGRRPPFRQRDRRLFHSTPSDGYAPRPGGRFCDLDAELRKARGRILEEVHVGARWAQLDLRGGDALLVEVGEDLVGEDCLRVFWRSRATPGNPRPRLGR